MHANDLMWVLVQNRKSGNVKHKHKYIKFGLTVFLSGNVKHPTGIFIM